MLCSRPNSLRLGNYGRRVEGVARWGKCSPQPRRSTKVAVISAPVSSSSRSADEPWSTRAQQQLQQQQQEPAAGEEDARLLALIKSLRAEADLLKALHPSGLTPVWMAAGELQQLAQQAPRSGACVGLASRGSSSWRHSSPPVAASGAAAGLNLNSSTLDAEAPTAQDVAEASPEPELLSVAPQVVSTSFEIWVPGQAQPVMFDPLAAEVAPGELEEAHGPPYRPLIFCLQDWRMAREQHSAAWASAHFCDQHSDVVVASEDEASMALAAASGEAAAVAAPGATYAASQESGQGQQQQATAAPSTVQATVTFRVKCRTDFGQRLWLVGDHAALGGWDCSKWLKMQWTAGDVWQAVVPFELQAGAAPATIKYKTVLEMAPGGEKCWTAGDSWKLQLAGPGPLEAAHTHMK